MLLHQSQLSFPMEDGTELGLPSLKPQPTQQKGAPSRPCCHCPHPSTHCRASRPVHPVSASPVPPPSRAVRSGVNHPAPLALPWPTPEPPRKEESLQVRNRPCSTPVYPHAVMSRALGSHPLANPVHPMCKPATHNPFQEGQWALPGAWVMSGARTPASGTLEQPNPLPLGHDASGLGVLKHLIYSLTLCPCTL